MLACIADPDPCLFIESVMLYGVAGPVEEAATPIPIGKATIAATGTDLTVVSYARAAHAAREAAAALREKGISAEVIDLRTIAPWDRDCVLSSVRKTGRALIVHEAVRTCGVGAEIAATIGEELHGALKAPVRRLCGPHAPVPFSRCLESAYMVSANAIAEAAEALVR